MKLLHPLALFVASMVIATQSAPVAQADDYPTRPITLIAPYPAGGGVDALCRMLAAKLSDRLGKPIIVENRAGAGSTIGVAAAARAAADGYTLVMTGSAGLATAVTVYKSLPYDPTKDFAPVARIADVPLVLVVNPSLPVRSVPDLIKLAKEKPSRLSYASAGPASPQHLFTELFKNMAGIEMMHVPYNGNSPAVNDVLAGHVPVLFSDPAAALPLIREGKLGTRCVLDDPVALRTGDPAHRRSWSSRLRSDRLAGDRVAGQHAEADRSQTSCRAEEHCPVA